MKTKIVLFGALSLVLSACSSVPSREDVWPQIVPGLSKAEAIKIMGPPDEFIQSAKGSEVTVWKMDQFEKCGVTFDAEAKVNEKTCQDNAEARAAYMNTVAQMRARMISNSIPSYTPIHSYQPARPVQTNCTTRYFGGVASTDCNSRATGIDASIYR